MSMHSTSLYSVIFLAMLYLSGCASMQPLSNFARSGDTVTVSLGGTESNALAPILRKEDLRVLIVDASGRTFPVKVRNVFRVYSDPTSRYDFISPSSKNYPYETYVHPHQGIWMAVLDLVDPATEQPLALATGQATFNIQSAKLKPWVDYPGWGWSWTNGNLSSVSIEIIAGTGSKNPLNYLKPVSYSPLDGLEPQPQVEVTPTGMPSRQIGGGLFVFKYVVASFSDAPRIFTSTPDPNVQLASNAIPQGDGTALLKVMISNPHGFNVNNTKLDQSGSNMLLSGGSLLRSLRFSIVWDSSDTSITDANWQNSIQLVSSRYVDLNGNSMQELTPVMTKVR